MIRNQELTNLNPQHRFVFSQNSPHEDRHRSLRSSRINFLQRFGVLLGYPTGNDRISHPWEKETHVQKCRIQKGIGDCSHSGIPQMLQDPKLKTMEFSTRNDVTDFSSFFGGVNPSNLLSFGSGLLVFESP